MRRTMMLVPIAALAIATLAVAPALAGKASSGSGGKGGSGGSGSNTLTLVLLNSSDGQAHYGQSVTFKVSSSVAKPMVELDCSQAGTLVYTHSAGFYPDYPWPWLQTYGLSSGAWTGGAADCIAKMYTTNNKGGFVTLMTLSFPALA